MVGFFVSEKLLLVGAVRGIDFSLRILRSLHRPKSMPFDSTNHEVYRTLEYAS